MVLRKLLIKGNRILGKHILRVPTKEIRAVEKLIRHKSLIYEYRELK